MISLIYKVSGTNQILDIQCSCQSLDVKKMCFAMSRCGFCAVKIYRRFWYLLLSAADAFYNFNVQFS